MNYDNYERKIVEQHGVALEGWPVGRIRNPGSIGGRDAVMKLLESLNSRDCHWKILSAAELEDRIADNQARAKAGEDVYKVRRSRKSNVKSAARVDSENEEQDDPTSNGSDSE
jgi:hypothetical protein